MSYYTPFIKNLEKIKNLDLKSESFFNQVKDFVEKAQDYNHSGEANYLLGFLNKKLAEQNVKEDNSELFRKYQDIQEKLKVITLHSLPQAEFNEIFAKHITELFSHLNFSAREIVRIKLFSYIDAFRDDIKAEIREALKKSKSQIGKEYIKLEKEEALKPPSVENWLKDFTDKLGAGLHSHYEIIHYIFGTFNAEKLNLLERRILQRLLELYEDLKVSTYEVGAIDNPSLEIFIPLLEEKHVSRSTPRRYGEMRIRREGRRRFSQRFKEKKEIKNTKTDKIEDTRGNIQTGKIFLKKEEEPFTIKPLPLKRSEKDVDRMPFTPERKVISPISLRPKKIEEVLGGAPIAPRAKKLEEGLAGPAIPHNVILKLGSPGGLLGLSISDFRFFSSNPNEAVRFMFNKIRKLITNRPIDRLKIKEAFANSLLYKLYLSQGKEALDTRKTISEIAALRHNQGREYMTEEEYRAVGAVVKAI